MNNHLDDDVNDILAILQQNTGEDKAVKKTEKKTTTNKTANVLKPVTPSVSAEEKEKKQTDAPKIKAKSGFLIEIEEPNDKSIYNSKVLIREEIYEVFMSLKRIKKFKSVSTLVDYALEEYIKNHREDIKKTIYDSKNHEIL